MTTGPKANRTTFLAIITQLVVRHLLIPWGVTSNSILSQVLWKKKCIHKCKKKKPQVAHASYFKKISAQTNDQNFDVVQTIKSQRWKSLSAHKL